MIIGCFSTRTCSQKLSKQPVWRSVHGSDIIIVPLLRLQIWVKGHLCEPAFCSRWCRCLLIKHLNTSRKGSVLPYSDHQHVRLMFGLGLYIFILYACSHLFTEHESTCGRPVEEIGGGGEVSLKLTAEEVWGEVTPKYAVNIKTTW